MQSPLFDNEWRKQLAISAIRDDAVICSKTPGHRTPPREVTAEAVGVSPPIHPVDNDDEDDLPLLAIAPEARPLSGVAAAVVMTATAAVAVAVPATSATTVSSVSVSVISATATITSRRCRDTYAEAAPPDVNAATCSPPPSPPPYPPRRLPHRRRLRSHSPSRRAGLVGRRWEVQRVHVHVILRRVRHDRVDENSGVTTAQPLDEPLASGGVNADDESVPRYLLPPDGCERPSLEA